MPIYEFDCEECGARFDALLDSGTAKTECRACGAVGAKRRLSAPSPSPRLVMTGRQDRRMQIKRGVDRSTAKERFVKRRQDARARKKAEGK